ncbi:TPA: helix-turn-helix domain-containing protein [Enterococcus faecalis]|nr:helix-turn-helix domain-containing protein [Enterococcus faecalis]
MYQDERKLDFKPLGIAIKKAREAKGWTQEYLAQLVDLTPRSIMYIENRGQHPRLNKFYLITTLLDISVDQFFFPCNEDGDNNRRKQVDVLLNDMEEKELIVMEAGLVALYDRRFCCKVLNLLSNKVE